MTLNDIEIFTDELERKTENLISERNMLRSELERFSQAHIERDRDFVNAARENIRNFEASSEQNFRLNHFLVIK